MLVKHYLFIYMQKNIIITLLSIVAGGAFVLFSYFHLLTRIPGFSCEGFGCIGTAFIELFIGIIVIPALFGIVQYFISKENRTRRALTSSGISFFIMLISLVVLAAWNTNTKEKNIKDDKQLMQELYEAKGFPLSQLEQDLPLLDSKHPITIVNQLSNSNTVTDAPFNVQVYARDDVMLSGETLEITIWTFIPQSTERRYVATGTLFSTHTRSSDGRNILEGTLLVANTFGATDGFLSVTGKDGISSSFDILFRK